MPAFTTDEISAIERYEGDEESKSLFLMEELVKSMRRITGLPTQIEKTTGPDRIKKILQFLDHRDMESILFAKYAATFPGKNPIPIQCGDCGHTYNIWKYLNTKRLANINSHLIGHDEDLYEILAFTKYFETLNLDELAKTSQISYIKDNDRNEIIECIRRLHIDDKNELVNAVQVFRDYFYVRHMTPDSTCTKCKSLNTGVYLPIRSFLFFRIRQGKSIETVTAD